MAKPLAFTGIETENLIEEKVNKARRPSIDGQILLRKVLSAIRSFHVNNTYYFAVPASLILSKITLATGQQQMVAKHQDLYPKANLATDLVYDRKSRVGDWVSL